jgi:hypothetical protein
MSWWWLSFCDGNKPAGSQFLGVAVVQIADGGMIGAVRRAHQLGINPGGEVMGFEVRAGIDPPVELREKLVADKAVIQELSDQWADALGVGVLMSDGNPTVSDVIRMAEFVQETGEVPGNLEQVVVWFSYVIVMLDAQRRASQSEDRE